MDVRAEVARHSPRQRCGTRRPGQRDRLHKPRQLVPELWVYSAMTDRLRRTESGWRIFERRVGPTSMSDQLGSAASNRGADPYAPQAANW